MVIEVDLQMLGYLPFSRLVALTWRNESHLFSLPMCQSTNVR